MAFLAALALAASAVPDAPARAPDPQSRVQATAQVTVRLLEGATVSFDRHFAANAHARVTMIRLADGEHQANIVEFE